MKKQSSEITCAECGEQAPRRGPVQKYCLACSEKRSLISHEKWRKKNPAKWTPEKKAADDEDNKRSREFGSAASVARSQQRLSDNLPENIGGAPWYVRFAVPFTYEGSKNHIYGVAKGGGHVFKRKQSTAYRDAITYAARSAIRDVRLFNNKVWLDFHIQKPNHRGDAVNIVDLVCDALKDALGVDDRWFSVRKLDWEIVKVNPQVYIGISQPDAFDAQACSYCGGIKPFEAFGKKTSNKNGIDRVCRECRRAKPTSEAA